ncbi:MAG: relaxase/mobilization nuclease domain-containing protein [Bacteroidetes bacterium]|nr:relaxase/mobilization nuclease domain-containing protein [Bacteroidota bacterium]
MHAIITYNKNIRRLLQYHELKVQRGAAEFLYAGNYFKDKEDLTMQDKMYPFLQRASLNEQVRARILHLVLRFDPEDHPSNDKMTMVAREYLQKMGWGNEPYIVYRHKDTIQPHLHIALPKIRPDGRRLMVTRDDYYRSKKEVRRLEMKYSLRPSDKATRAEDLRRFPLQKIRFGETPLWLAMNKIFEEVLSKYRFTSLDELNAALRLYNLKASRGRSDSFTRKNGGLLYVPLTDTGKETGTYIKASMFPSRPTLKTLEKLFVKNQPLREPDRQRVTVAIDWTLHNKSLSLDAFRKSLEKEQISTVVRRDANGDPENIWYVDHQKKTVFEGQALGPQYTVPGITKRCISNEDYQLQQQRQHIQSQQLKPRMI